MNTRLEQFRDYFEGITRERHEEPPEEITRAVEKADDLMEDEHAREASKIMEKAPSDEEIRDAVQELRELIHGEDWIKISYVRKEWEDFVERIVKIVQVIIESPAESWEESLRLGIIVSLFKKESRGYVNSYREQWEVGYVCNGK